MAVTRTSSWPEAWLLGKTLGLGQYDFGEVDLAVLISCVSKSLELTAIGSLSPRSRIGIFSLAKKNIQRPKDLEGKKVGFAAGSGDYQLWPAFVKATGIDDGKVQKVFMGPEASSSRSWRSRSTPKVTATARCAEWKEELACEVARAGQLVKGYGDVRRRLAAVVDDLVHSVQQAASLEALAGEGFAVSTALAATYRRLVLEGPEGETKASALAAKVLGHLAANEREAALATVSAAPA